MTKRKLVVPALLLASALPAFADTVTFAGSNGSLSAAATFTVSGNNLVITLTNTSTADVLVPADVLTGIFFDLSGVPALTPVSAIVPAGNLILFAPSGQCTSGPCNVSGEWGYATNLSGAPGAATSGLSSSGLGLFGPSSVFPGPNLQGPADPGGLQYGITSAGDDPNTGNSAVAYTTKAGKNPGKVPASNALIQNTVIFTLTGLPNNTVLAGNISNVTFQYGTALTEPSFRGSCTHGCTTVPEPGTLALFGIGLPALAALIRRRMAA